MWIDPERRGALGATITKRIGPTIAFSERKEAEVCILCNGTRLSRPGPSAHFYYYDGSVTKSN